MQRNEKEPIHYHLEAKLGNIQYPQVKLLNTHFFSLAFRLLRLRYRFGRFDIF
jgi:hypothetical protein